MTDSIESELYSVQVKKGHYADRKYLSSARWSTNAAIIDETIGIDPKSVLEIGPGPGIVTATLRQMGFMVRTLDLDPDIRPDYLLSATDENITSKIDHIDLIIASEIFEHVKYDDFVKSCGKLRVLARFMILTLPDTNEKSLSFGTRIRLPLLNSLSFLWKLRFGTVRHAFDGEHYWEIGKKGFPAKRIRKDIIEQGWNIKREYVNIDNPYHRFFILG